MNVDIKKDDDRKDDDCIIIAADSTGIKVTNRGQWVTDKWNIKKKGHLKIHIAIVNIDQRNPCIRSNRREST